MAAAVVRPFPVTVSRDLLLHCLDLHGRPAAIVSTFRYDAADPWAVAVTFRTPQQDVTWVLSRSILLEGRHSDVGRGDVRAWPTLDADGRQAVVVDFHSPDGSLLAQVDRPLLDEFLAATLVEVPLGQERIDLDALLDELTRAR